MPFRLTRRVFEIAAICVALGLLAVMGMRLAQAHGLLLANGNPVFGDFIAYWSAGRVVLAGHADLVHTPAVVQAVQWAEVPGMRWVAPWNSPPQFLLIATALALLPFPIAALTWLAASGALYLAAAQKLLPDRRALLFALLLPSALYHLGSVQTGLWMAGVTGLALYWLDKNPLRSGALIGLLAIKPHLAVLWPIYLALTGRWRAFGAAMVSLALFTLAAILAFGWESFPRFLDNLGATQHLIDAQLVARETFASLYGNLVALGVANGAAMIAHALSAVAAVGVSVLVFRRPDLRAQGAAFCAATVLATPYLFFYDLTLLAVGAALLAPPRTRFEIAAIVAGWGAGLTLAVAEIITLPIGPAAAWMVLIAAAQRSRGGARTPDRVPREQSEAEPDQGEARRA